MEFRDTLHKSVQEILEYIESLTGKGFQFIEKPDMIEFAGVKTARANMPQHIIIYKPEHNKFINHLIAHECGHIKRMFETPLEKRFSVAITPDLKGKALHKIEKEILNLSKKIGDNKTIQFTNMMYDGTVRQLTNQPIDLLIEKWLYNDYPQLRSLQLDSLIEQNRLGLQGTTKEVKNIIPSFFYKTSNLMNAAYTDLLSKIVGYKLVRDWKKSEYFDESKSLSLMLDIDKGWMPEEDIDKVNAWAELLNLHDFFMWNPFENIPPDYLKTN